MTPCGTPTKPTVAPARAQPTEGPPFPRSLAERVLAESHRLVLERHLETAAPADLALWSLRGLAAEMHEAFLKSGGRREAAPQVAPQVAPIAGTRTSQEEGGKQGGAAKGSG